MSKVGPIRRTIGFVCATALTGTGAYGLGSLILYEGNYPLWMLVGSILVGCAGICWLWADYINADPRP